VSSQLERGSTFTVRLPVDAGAVAEAPARELDAPDSGAVPIAA
jgi:hypothetical protein